MRKQSHKKPSLSSLKEKLVNSIYAFARTAYLYKHLPPKLSWFFGWGIAFLVFFAILNNIFHLAPLSIGETNLTYVLNLHVIALATCVLVVYLLVTVRKYPPDRQHIPLQKGVILALLVTLIAYILIFPLKHRAIVISLFLLEFLLFWATGFNVVFGLAVFLGLKILWLILLLKSEIFLEYIAFVIFIAIFTVIEIFSIGRMLIQQLEINQAITFGNLTDPSPKLSLIRMLRHTLSPVIEHMMQTHQVSKHPSLIKFFLTLTYLPDSSLLVKQLENLDEILKEYTQVLSKYLPTKPRFSWRVHGKQLRKNWAQSNSIWDPNEVLLFITTCTEIITNAAKYGSHVKVRLSFTSNDIKCTVTNDINVVKERYQGILPKKLKLLSSIEQLRLLKDRYKLINVKINAIRKASTIRAEAYIKIQPLPP